MKIKYENEWYDVLDTKCYFGKTFYAIENEPCHVKWIDNPDGIRYK